VDFSLPDVTLLFITGTELGIPEMITLTMVPIQVRMPIPARILILIKTPIPTRILPTITMIAVTLIIMMEPILTKVDITIIITLRFLSDLVDFLIHSIGTRSIMITGALLIHGLMIHSSIIPTMDFRLELVTIMVMVSTIMVISIIGSAMAMLLGIIPDSEIVMVQEELFPEAAEYIPGML
jgi:hypothetical protein